MKLKFSAVIEVNPLLPPDVYLQKFAWHVKRGFDENLVEHVRVELQDERTCVWCGCTDSKACAGGCYWVEQHAATPTGVCSACAAKLEDLEVRVRRVGRSIMNKQTMR